MYKIATMKWFAILLTLAGTLAHLQSCLGAEDAMSKNADIRSRAGFDDPAFKEAVIMALGNSKRAPTNEILFCDPIETIRSLDLSYPSGMMDISGIQQFVALTSLVCSGQSFTNIEIGACTNLVFLKIERNDLKELDLSKAVHLQLVKCSFSSLMTNLILPRSSARLCVECFEADLRSLDLSTCPKVYGVVCRDNAITHLSLRGCVELRGLWGRSNRLSSIDVSGCPKLEMLELSCNQLTGILDLSSCTNLNSVDLWSNKLSEIIVCNTNKLPKEFKCDTDVKIREPRSIAAQ